MNFNIQAETVTFFLSILLGVLLGMFYDVFRILRIAFRHKLRTIFAEDICFFTVSAFLTFIFALVGTRGVIRSYQLIGEISGFTVYYYTLGEATVFFANKIITFIKIVFIFINKMIISPILFIIEKAFKILILPFRFLFSFFKKSLKKVKYTLKRVHILLYNQKKERLEKRKEPKSDEGRKNSKKRKQKKVC